MQFERKFQVSEFLNLSESKVHSLVDRCLLKVSGGALLLNKALLSLVMLGQNHTVALIVLTPIVIVEKDPVFYGQEALRKFSFFLFSWIITFRN